MLCKVMRVSRSSYYEWRSACSKPNREEIMLKSKLQHLFEKSRKTYGSRRLLKALKAEGYKIGRYKVRNCNGQVKSDTLSL